MSIGYARVLPNISISCDNVTYLYLKHRSRCVLRVPTSGQAGSAVQVEDTDTPV